MSPDLSILIVNWNSKDYLRRCLESIRATCADFSLQIVVVDGASFDGCAEMLAAEFPEVEFVQSEENIGFGRSNNLGFQRVKAKALLLLNPDTELKPGGVRFLYDELSRTSQAGIIGARLLNTDGTPQTSCVQSFPTPLNQALNSEILRRVFPNSKLWGIAALQSKDTPRPVEAVSGACMMLWSETFRQLDGFDPAYFMYGEDMDLCARAAQWKLNRIYVPRAEIIHHGGGSSTGKFSRVSAIFMRESINTFIHTHQGMFAAWRYRCLIAISAVVRLALLLPARLLASGKKKENRTQAVRKWWTNLRWSLGLESMKNWGAQAPVAKPAGVGRVTPCAPS